MASRTLAQFRSRFVEFAAVPDDLVDLLLIEAYNLTVSFGINQGTAQGYLAAHLLTMSQGGQAQGAQTVSAGSASVSFAYTGANGYLSTGYGKLYLMLARLYGGCRIVTGLPGLPVTIT